MAEGLVVDVAGKKQFLREITPEEENRRAMRRLEHAEEVRQDTEKATQRRNDLEALKTAGLPELREILSRLLDAE